MRVTQSELYRNFLADMNNINKNLADIDRQLSSGKKVNKLADSPSGSADLVVLTDKASRIDAYRSNIGVSAYYLKTAETALNETNNLVGALYALGSQAVTDTVNNEGRAAIAIELRIIMEQLLSLANSRAGDRFIFAGSQSTAAPFAVEDGAVVYKGDDRVNGVFIDDGVQVRQGVAGNEAFGAIFSTLGDLLNSLEGNDIPGIKKALEGVSSALSDLGTARGRIGVNLGLLRNQTMVLDANAVMLKERQSALEDADMLAATVRLTQLQNTLETTMAVGGAALSRKTLFDILG
ncbi:MAG TPA: flagellar hook-associated protein FlgL [Acidobacteriota bacterium]|nr:flagellar hook-associated protein FlgL [Acidobacteriota bacterium]